MNPLKVLSWRAPWESSDDHRSFFILVDELGAPGAPWLRNTTISTEDTIFFADSMTGDITGIGFCILIFMLHHSSALARDSFEVASGLWFDSSEYLCLASVPLDDSDDLGLTLLVRMHSHECP